jgi:DNA-directed RNA polymerase specialized sigma24 family protein
MMAQRKPPARTRVRMVSDTESRYPDWETVYADNAIWVYRMIVKRVGNVPDAEDLTAEVFLAALRPLRTTATVAQVRGYLRATTRTVLAAHWRQTKGCEITSIDDVPDLPQEAEHGVDNATAQQVHRVLAALV